MWPCRSLWAVPSGHSGKVGTSPPHPGHPALWSGGLIPGEGGEARCCAGVHLVDPGTSGITLVCMLTLFLIFGYMMNVEGQEPEGHEICAPSSERLFPYQSFHKVGLLKIC